MRARIEELPKITRNFAKPARTRVFKGGRGSGKTRGLAKRSAIRIYQLAEMGVEGVFLASREHLNSLDESSMEEIKAAIKSEPWLAAYFDVGEKYIRTRNRRISYAFAGLRHNLDSIKSKARIIGNWTDEAENVSEAAWRKLVNTLREEGEVSGVKWHVENWVSYNPESPESAVNARFVADPPDDCIVTTVNWTDNPWFPSSLNKQRLEDQRRRPETYDHVWGGEFLTLTEAQVFSGKYIVADFEPHPGWDGPYQGLDFGFSQDPTAAVQVWIHDNKLWIRHEAGGKRLELDETAGRLKTGIPGVESHTIRGDSARPESISYLKRHGLPLVVSADKWTGCVEDGVSYIKSFERVVIHSECAQTAREFRLYSHKIDPRSEEIRPEIVDANNHYIDATRYALGPMIKGRGKLKISDNLMKRISSPAGR